MKIVIDIPKDVYMEIMAHNRERRIGSKSSYYFEGLIQNGKPLPKGRGRLIDADAYRKEMLNSREFDFFKRLDMQPTIIEADKEE